MIEIFLKKGSTKLDIEDWLNLPNGSMYKLKNGYTQFYSGDLGIKEYLHRIIMNAKKGQEVDHINGDRCDNRRSNLRICNRSQNQANANRSLPTSGYRGVTFDKYRNKFQAQISVRGKNINLGRFDKAIDAAMVYDLNVKKYFGEFSKPNFK